MGGFHASRWCINGDCSTMLYDVQTYRHSPWDEYDERQSHTRPLTIDCIAGLLYSHVLQKNKHTKIQKRHGTDTVIFARYKSWSWTEQFTKCLIVGLVTEVQRGCWLKQLQQLGPLSAHPPFTGDFVSSGLEKSIVARNSTCVRNVWCRYMSAVAQYMRRMKIW